MSEARGGAARRAALLAIALWLASGTCPAQVIPSALPSIGRVIDLRDVRGISASRGEAIVTASHVYQAATRFFGPDGKRRNLSLNQTVERRAFPVQASYGFTDRWNLGAGLALDDSIERTLSVLNFVPGAAVAGQDLPAGQVTRLEISGSGPGDLDLLAQYRMRWPERGIVALAALDLIVPTAESTPAGALDVPIGQGYWAARLSASALREIFPMTYFVRVVRELAAGGAGHDAQARRFTFEPGDGFEWIGGGSYAIGAGFSLQGLVAGSWRDAGRRSDQAQPTAATRSLELRPGYSFQRGSWIVTQQLSLPIAGRNTLSTEGFLTSVEVRF